MNRKEQYVGRIQYTQITMELITRPWWETSDFPNTVSRIGIPEILPDDDTPPSNPSQTSIPTEGEEVSQIGIPETSPDDDTPPGGPS